MNGGRWVALALGVLSSLLLAATLSGEGNALTSVLAAVLAFVAGRFDR